MRLFFFIQIPKNNAVDGIATIMVAGGNQVSFFCIDIYRTHPWSEALKFTNSFRCRCIKNTYYRGISPGSNKFIILAYCGTIEKVRLPLVYLEGYFIFYIPQFCSTIPASGNKVLIIPAEAE